METVTLHVDGRPGNSGLFGEAEFAAMQPGSLFLNLSRGFVVDHGALRRSIESGHIAGAAIDVFPEEPKAPREEFTSVLRGLPNVILTPHVGGSTEEAQQDIGEFVAGEADRLRRRPGRPRSASTCPRSRCRPRPGTHRWCTSTRTSPACWRPSTGCWPTTSVNVEGQMLGTRDEIGYAITDIGSAYSAEVLAQLNAMDVTIRLRTIRCA